MGKLVNKSELAEILGKTQQTLTTWQSKGMPVKLVGKRGTSNEYDTSDVIDWYVKKEIGKLTVDESGKYFDLEKERSRLTHHQANKTALEEEVLKGNLLPSDEVIEVWGNYISSVRAKLLSMPTKLAHSLINCSDFEDVEAILKKGVFEALQELSEYNVESNHQITKKTK